MTPHLLIDQAVVTYGAVRALNQISIHAAKGETVALIGPNGAGKSSLLLAIAGVVPLRSGAMRLDGRDLAGQEPEQRVGLGISLVPETRDVFKKLSTHENLLIGASRRRLSRAQILADADRIYALFPRLAERHAHMAGFLSGGEQQMLAIGRALMACPGLLMLDEPSLGLAPVVTDAVYAAIAALRDQGTTILLVEQNAARAFSVCDRAYLIQAGQVIEEGRAEALSARGSVETVLFGYADAGKEMTQ
ncbi:ABC transporter ATP-binding protein [Xinfangfangia pollutisoli]|uniref:ABC transporter ATP-binding protein n=1 Tax=Xinfangfangia pollutisoli TaxID=2865960 RepID=UPI001CD47FF9|nr:ABC transporter ATP-binding protein [Xinfangfangia pollutisoli]